MFHLDPLSLIVPELSDEHKTVREIPLNSPGREPRRLGEARQLAARKPLQHGTPKLRANQPLSG